METNIFLTQSPNLEIYQTDDLRKWIGIYLHACRSRNLAGGTLEFYSKKLGAFAQFCLENNAANIPQISADLIRQFLISLDERGHRPAGIHCYYRSVKTFLKWYERETEPEDWRNPINKVDGTDRATRATGPGQYRNDQSHVGNLQAGKTLRCA